MNSNQVIIRLKDTLFKPYDDFTNVYIVTVEDKFETEFGDGEYQDIEKCFWNLNEAKEFLEIKKTVQTHIYRILTVKICIDMENNLILKNRLPYIYETININRIISSLNNELCY